MKQMLRAVLDYIQLHHIVPNWPVLKKSQNQIGAPVSRRISDRLIRERNNWFSENESTKHSLGRTQTSAIQGEIQDPVHFCKQDNKLCA